MMMITPMPEAKLPLILVEPAHFNPLYLFIEMVSWMLIEMKIEHRHM